MLVDGGGSARSLPQVPLPSPGEPFVILLGFMMRAGT